ncbi:retrovirus-related pol polyprotein from transposon TNT 1-94, partial [Tanacetum coccineum]
TLLPPLEKLPGAEPQTRPKTFKSILKSCLTRRVETSKGVIINESNISSAPTKGNKNVSTSKKHLATTRKLKDVKIEDDIPITVHTTTDHNDIEWFRRGEILLANKAESINASRSKIPTKRNNILVNLCDERGISQNFSFPYTPEQNGVAERRNRNLIEAGRTMLAGSIFSKHYWTEAIIVACYTQNRSIIVKIHLKTPHELFRGGLPNISFLHVFRCPTYIHNHKDYLGNLDEKANNGYFLGYSLVSKAFRVFNTRRQQIEETFHISFDESIEAIRFSKPSVEDITIAESERYPPDEYLHHFEPSQRNQVDSNVV